MKKCTNCEKYYDENVNTSCPYCNDVSISEDLFGDIDSDNKTVPYPNPSKPSTPPPMPDVGGKNSSSVDIPTNRRPVYDDIFDNDDNKTVVITNASKDTDIASVVGWLVVIEGKGMGRDLRVVAGMNSIGREKNNKISISFGDNSISRENHATVIYDYKNNKFFFQHGGGQNLSYLNDSVVLQPMELNKGDVIGLGDTKLMFIPFCSEQFKWDKAE